MMRSRHAGEEPLQQRCIIYEAIMVELQRPPAEKRLSGSSAIKSHSATINITCQHTHTRTHTYTPGRSVNNLSTFCAIIMLHNQRNCKPFLLMFESFHSPASFLHFYKHVAELSVKCPVICFIPSEIMIYSCRDYYFLS